MLKTIKQSQGIPANLTKWQNLWCKKRATKTIQENQSQMVPNMGYLKLCINVQSKGGARTILVNREL